MKAEKTAEEEGKRIDLEEVFDEIVLQCIEGGTPLPLPNATIQEFKSAVWIEKTFGVVQEQQNMHLSYKVKDEEKATDDFRRYLWHEKYQKRSARPILELKIGNTQVNEYQEYFTKIQKKVWDSYFKEYPTFFRIEKAAWDRLFEQ